MAPALPLGLSSLLQSSLILHLARSSPQNTLQSLMIYSETFDPCSVWTHRHSFTLFEPARSFCCRLPLSNILKEVTVFVWFSGCHGAVSSRRDLWWHLCCFITPNDTKWLTSVNRLQSRAENPSPCLSYIFTCLTICLSLCRVRSGSTTDRGLWGAITPRLTESSTMLTSCWRPTGCRTNRSSSPT